MDVPLDLVVVAAVVALAAIRLWSNPVAFRGLSLALFPVRRYVAPVADRLLSRVGLYAKTSVGTDEFVANLDITHAALTRDLLDAGAEPQVLASVATDWAGRTERSSWAHYHGPKPGARLLPAHLVDRLPEWTRKYQTHIRPFGPDGDLDVTGHDERNPWRPDQAVQHLFGMGLDADEGVTKTADLLGIDPEDSP